MDGDAVSHTTIQLSDNATEFLSAGQMNRVLGWTMMLTGMAMAAALDPWSFSPQSSTEYANSLRPAVRHLQGVMLAMSLLQLALAHLLATPAFDRKVGKKLAVLTAVGATTYTAGYVLGLFWPACYWLVLVGSLLNFTGFAYLWWAQPAKDQAVWIATLAPIVCFGMLLDFVAGLFEVLPEQSALAYLGAVDGVRLRMMRLARVAAIALSVLSLLAYNAPRPRTTNRTAHTRGSFFLTWGAVGMPSILAVACFTSLQWKYLLALPATAVVTGVFFALITSCRRARPLECWGWALIATSTSAGMLMGLYAFDGPLRTPQFLGAYNETPRRLAWLAHSYCIVLGVMAVFLARESKEKCDFRRSEKVGALLFITGSAVTIGVLVRQIFAPSSICLLSVGPTLVVIAAAVCLAGLFTPWPVAELHIHKEHLR